MSEKVLKCFNCGESGHISANCQQEAKEPQKGSRSKAQKGSSNQSKKGTETRNSNIISKNKKALKGPVERVCWHCGSKGHRRDACPDKPVDPNVVCFGCREKGHTLAMCPATKGGVTEKKSGGVSCYNCGQDGHASRNCQQPKAGFKFAVCFVCNEQGHLASACPQSKKGLYPRGGGCHACGSVEHLARNCPGKGVFNQTESEKLAEAKPNTRVSLKEASAAASPLPIASAATSQETLEDDGFEELEPVPSSGDRKKKRANRDQIVKSAKKRRY